MQRNLVVLQDQENTVIGSWTDEKLRLEKQNRSDWAYIGLLLSRFRDPPTASLSLFKPRDPIKQDKFRNRAFKAYDAFEKSKGLSQDWVWCCLSGKSITSEKAV